MNNLPNIEYGLVSNSNLRVLDNGPRLESPQVSEHSRQNKTSVFDHVKGYGKAAVGGCITSSSVMLAAAGTATLVSGGAAALPGGAAVAATCLTGAAGGAFTKWVNPPYDMSPMGDAYDGLRGIR